MLVCFARVLHVNHALCKVHKRLRSNEHLSAGWCRSRYVVPVSVLGENLTPPGQSSFSPASTNDSIPTGRGAEGEEGSRGHAHWTVGAPAEGRVRDDFSTLPTGRLTRTTVVDMIFAPGRRFQHWPVGEVSLPPVVSSPSVYTPCLPSLSFFLVVDSACWLWVVVAVDGRAQAHCLQDDVPHPPGVTSLWNAPPPFPTFRRYAAPSPFPPGRSIVVSCREPLPEFRMHGLLIMRRR